LSLDQNFSFLAGFAFVFGCLSLNQIAYVIGAAIIVFSEDPKASLTGDQADDGESYQGHGVRPWGRTGTKTPRLPIYSRNTKPRLRRWSAWLAAKRSKSSS